MAAPGPSLVPVRQGPVIAVQDAWRIIPWAEVLYGCDPQWWIHHDGVPAYKGERWSTHEDKPEHPNNKAEVHQRYGVRCVRGASGSSFSLNPSIIHYGDNSGFQAINLAILFGCTHITLVGFNMRVVGGKRHFFGDHPDPLGNAASYESWCGHFESAAKHLPPTIRIVNATPDSALRCFPIMSLDEAIEDRHVHDTDKTRLANRERGVGPRTVSGAATAL